MSSSEGKNPGTETSNEEPPSGDASSEGTPSEDVSSGDGRAIECVNCGHRFTGNFCPKCGQEADPPVSIVEVIGGFFREFIDLESGVWPTFVGLTVRPGEVLRRYLSGVRAGLIDPGRYLLAAVVISFGAVQGFTWLGLFRGPEASFTAAIPEEASERDRQTMEAFFEVVGQVTQSQWGTVAITLVSAGLLSLFFARLFRDRVHHPSEAFAISAFTVGHWTVLGAGLLPLIVLFEYLATGSLPSVSTYTIPRYLLAFAYSGIVAYSLGSGWKSAAWGALSGVWALVEAGAIFGLVTTVYFLWQVRPIGGLSGEGKTVFGVIVAIYLIPLFLHGAVELYYRLRH